MTPPTGPFAMLTTPLGEQTLERLDPLSAAAARPVTIGFALLAVVLPPLVFVTRRHEIVTPLWFAIAYLAVIVAAALVLDRARSTRPVGGAPTALLIQLLVATAAVASAASTAGANELLRDDWAPLVIGLLLVASMPYRPARELAAWAALHTVLCASLGFAQAPSAATGAPAIIHAITGSVTVASLGFAAAAYARSLTTSSLLWQQRAWRSAVAVAHTDRTALARSVQQGRITLLNHEVVPYLQRVIDADELTDRDRHEARRLAASIRALLVGEVEKPWAQQMLDEIVARHPRLGITAVAHDAADRGRQLSLDRRTLLRAIAAAIIERLAASELTLRVRASEGRLAVDCAFATSRSLSDARRELRAMLEVIRGLTRGVTLRERDGRLVLEFEYDY